MLFLDRQGIALKVGDKVKNGTEEGFVVPPLGRTLGVWFGIDQIKSYTQAEAQAFLRWIDVLYPTCGHLSFSYDIVKQTVMCSVCGCSEVQEDDRRKKVNQMAHTCSLCGESYSYVDEIQYFDINGSSLTPEERFTQNPDHAVYCLCGDCETFVDIYNNYPVERFKWHNLTKEEKGVIKSYISETGKYGLWHEVFGLASEGLTGNTFADWFSTEISGFLNGLSRGLVERHDDIALG